MSVFHRVASILAAVTIALPHRAAAQKTIVGLTGNVIRYHGDTIWVERDTAMRRTIYRADTVIRATWLNDRPATTETFVVRGDQALLIGLSDSAGKAVELKAPPRPLPAMIATMDRRMLEGELRTGELLSRVALPDNPMEPAVAPDPARTYQLSGTRTLLHHRDTVSVIHNCPALHQLDTTIYVLFGRDSVRRIAPSPRTFSSVMVYALFGDMRTALVSEIAASRRGPAPADLPRVGDGCGATR